MLILHEYALSAKVCSHPFHFILHALGTVNKSFVGGGGGGGVGVYQVITSYTFHDLNPVATI